jgi:hypothetical protein
MPCRTLVIYLLMGALRRLLRLRQERSQALHLDAKEIQILAELRDLLVAFSTGMSWVSVPSFSALFRRS